MVIIDETVESERESRPWRAIAATAAIVAVVVAGAVYWVNGGDDEADTSGGREPSTNILPTGEASVGLNSATGNVAGFPRGFPQTEAGAVEAYLGWIVAPTSGIQQPNAVLEEYYADVMPPDEASAEAADIFAGRDVLGLDDEGRYTGPLGTQPYAECFPEFGAYRSDLRSDVEVEVEVWMPCVNGIGSPTDTSDLTVFWGQTSAVMRWSEGDWRLSVADAGFTDAPTPADKNKINVSYPERAQILGDGWQMFDGASQVWPVELFGSEPS